MGIDTYGNMLKENWKYYWTPAIGSQNKHGGLCIALAKKWLREELNISSSWTQTLSWVFLIFMLQIWEFWFKIGSDLPSVDHWCMVGDFNMIEDFGDRIGGSHALIGATELVTWERLCLSFILQDAWHVTSFGR